MTPINLLLVALTVIGSWVAFCSRKLADRLTRWALDDVRANGRRVVPLCPFTASFISLHAPDYDDIVVQRLH